MDAVLLAAVLVRLIVPLAVFRWQFVGTLLIFLADLSDTPIIDIFGGQWFVSYQVTDKILDTYAMVIMLIVAMNWKDSATRGIGITLFLYRLIGNLAYIFTREAWLLIVFADFFTLFFLFNVTRNKFFSESKLFEPRMIVIMIALIAFKIAQEIILHYYDFTVWPQIYSFLGF